MLSGKSPGYDGLTKECYEHFQDNLKFYFINSLKESKTDGRLPISQRQAIIKLIAKKNGDKGFVKIWRPISEKLKHVLPELIFSNQTAYVKN